MPQRHRDQLRYLKGDPPVVVVVRACGLLVVAV